MTRQWIYFFLLTLFACVAPCVAQDASDVELKPYGSYTGGGIDTIDLTTGNLFLDIPLLSYPQLGKLPPLSFSVKLNNAPYSEGFVIVDPTAAGASYTLLARYDVSPPGSPARAPLSTPYIANGYGTVAQWYSNIGAYISSSFEGGIMTGSVALSGCDGCAPSSGVATLAAIDPSGTTHAMSPDLASFNSNVDVYRAPDGTGYKFIPVATCNLWDAINCAGHTGIQSPLDGSFQADGTLISPSGVSYSDTITPYAVPSADSPSARLLMSTATDPMNNQITRGPWYWSGYYSADSSSAMRQFYDMIYDGSGIALGMASLATMPKYVDSVGRTIPDIQSMQQALPEPNGTFGVLKWVVPGVGGSPQTYVITYQAVGSAGEQADPSGNYDPAYFAAGIGWGIRSIQLPNGTLWSFTYSGADLMQVTTPSGGSISYTYTPIVLYDAHLSASLICNGMCHAVKTRTESDGVNSWMTTYNYSAVTNLSGCPTATATTETDSLGNDTVHTFCALGVYLAASSFHEVQTSYYQGSATLPGGKLLKTVSTTYEYNQNITTQGITNVVPTNETTTIRNSVPSDLSAAVTHTMQYSADLGQPLFQATSVGCSGGHCSSYGSKNVNYVEPVSSTVCASYPVCSGASLRKDSTIYQWMQSGSYLDRNLLDLPYTEATYDASVNPALLVASTTFGYDESGSPQGIYGNHTSVSRWLNTGGSVTTSTQYNAQGMPVVTVDGNGNASGALSQHSTHITYDSTGLFPQLIQHPSTAGVAHNDSYTHDSSFGKVLSHTDQNLNVTRYEYDSLARVTHVKYPTTPGGAGESIMCYTDQGGAMCGQDAALANSVYITSVSSPSPNVLTIHTYDGLGRKTHDNLASDPLGPVLVDTTYDEFGRVLTVTNPYRTTPAPGDPPRGSTQTTYDALGRIVQQMQPDGNSVWSCYDNLPVIGQPNCSPQQLTATYLDWVDTTDELGHHTQRITDVLGRLGTVLEPDPATNQPTLLTEYGYDVLNNLTSVDQWGGARYNQQSHFRRFTYDSLSRLLTSYNPETNSVCYGGSDCTGGYDANGNLLLKTDKRGITINYNPPESPIDALNRVTKKTYSNGDPAVNFVYDSPTVPNGIGRLASEFTGSATNPIATRQVLGYDAMGHLTGEQRCIIALHCTVTAGKNYDMSFSYDAAGKPMSYSTGYGNFP